MRRNLPERKLRELIRGENARAEFAIFAQHALKETLDQRGPIPHINGLGRRRAVINPELAARLRVKYWGDVGHDPLTDPDFLNSLLKDNPFLRVQTAPEKLSIRVDGLRDSPPGAPAPRGPEAAENLQGPQFTNSASSGTQGPGGPSGKSRFQTAGPTARHAAPGEPARPKLPLGDGVVSPIADRTSRDRNTCSGHETASGRSGRLESGGSRPGGSRPPGAIRPRSESTVHQGTVRQGAPA